MEPLRLVNVITGVKFYKIVGKFTLLEIMTVQLLSTEDSFNELCVAEIENLRKSKQKILNLLKQLEVYIFENPEMFKLNLENNAHYSP